MNSEQVRIERLVAGGDSLGRLADGRVVFVPGALAGELVDVQITQSKKDFARGTVTNIIEASEHRVEPPCPHVARGCGGCSWQHLDNSQHMDAKIGIVKEALRRTAKMESSHNRSALRLKSTFTSPLDPHIPSFLKVWLRGSIKDSVRPKGESFSLSFSTHVLYYFSLTTGTVI